jgi:S-methylmethionine-dependent homocysteine/selenocysteine methylase
MAGFPEPQRGVLYLTEGGQETELMYKHGHELPEFAMYPLLDDQRAVADLTAMYTRYLEVAAAHGFVALMGGLDYRASPDWASKLGVSREGLAEFQLRSIEFPRDVARPFEGQLPGILIAGIVGPRGDAYGRNQTITADEAEEYHGVQIDTLRRLTIANRSRSRSLRRAVKRANRRSLVLSSTSVIGTYIRRWTHHRASLTDGRSGASRDARTTRPTARSSS